MGQKVIALLTDFGIQNSYVGAVKGVIAGISPKTSVIDITHNIPAGDIQQAAFILWQAIPYFPQSTIFLSVVDPGVGTDRRSIGLMWPDRYCIGPDNGLFSYLIARYGLPKIVSLDNQDFMLNPSSNTFHGRDIYAPIAAHLAAGAEFEDLGAELTDCQILPLPRLELKEGPEIHGEILHHDQFGNLITSIGSLRYENKDLLLEPWLLQCPPARIPSGGLRVHLPNGAYLILENTFADVEEGAALAYIGSSGLLEIGINRGSALDSLPIGFGQDIIMKYRG